MSLENIILEKEYDAETIVDLDEDFHWALNESNLPKCEDGITTGHFEVKINWVPDE